MANKIEGLNAHDSDYGLGSNTSLDAIQTLAIESTQELRRGFKPRHVNMFAIAGSIGTGIIIGSGTALANGGPGNALIAYCLMGTCVYFVMSAFAEMAIFAPMNKGFSGYATRFVDPAVGFATGWNYWFKYGVLLANNLTASSLIIKYWRPDINAGCLPISKFGELEFWFAIFKVIVLVGLILCAFIISLGAGPTGSRVGFHYWQDPGAFASYLVKGSAGKFLGFWACVIQAIFMFMGTEVVGITYGEAKNPRKAIPRAVKQTIARIAIFYIGGIIVLGMAVPYNNSLLLGANKTITSSSASPFVVAMKIAGIQILPDIVNGCFLVFTLSFANSDIYIASRTLYGLARDNQAPKVFAKTNSYDVPIYAVVASALFGLIALLNVSTSSATAFTYFVSLSTVLGALNWVNILISYLGFRRGIKAQNIDRSRFEWRAPWQPYATYFTLSMTFFVLFGSGYTAFINGFKYEKFIVAYIGIIAYLVNIFTWKLVKKTKRVRPDKMSLVISLRNYEEEEGDKNTEKTWIHRIASSLWGAN
ncbi:amino acid transporter-7 [Coleophoma crateriformis]|uniref:Amino acid transporter-7 n=1 Tax=Coleophoma crateriformis TaxID=565419 RepID=A0A3D8R8C0_9HELO|nr:amino acid transporter-7 [Coleophoma crateriformis]